MMSFFTLYLLFFWQIEKNVSSIINGTFLKQLKAFLQNIFRPTFDAFLLKKNLFPGTFPCSLLFLIFSLSLFAEEEPLPTTPALKAKYAALNPSSVAQNFAFYELYPETNEGKLALKRAMDLLNAKKKESVFLPEIDLYPLIAIINRESTDTPSLKKEDLRFIDELAQDLCNRSLKGFGTWDESEIFSLAPEEIDIARGLFLAQYGSSEEAQKLIKTYEASIDLMTLQIQARLSSEATDLEKIHAINHFIFHEMEFRFPPHSLWAKDVDVYTFLPSVIDSRRGVCLGVSILYLCIAQRLNLPLQAITPPGHIYVRYLDEEEENHLNIETTARGIHIPSEVYKSVETRKLQQRNPFEVIGLAFMNQAAVSWGREDYKTAISLYEKARQYLPEDELITQFLGFNYLFVGETEKGKELLKTIKGYTPDYAISKETVIEDYLNKKTDVEGIKAIFLPVDETRESILKKQNELQQIIKKYPYFRAGLLQLAGTFMQLGKEKQALKLLEKYYAISKEDPIINYYLSIICYQRYDYTRAWKFLNNCERLTANRNHHPKALKEFRKALLRVCPEPGI